MRLFSACALVVALSLIASAHDTKPTAAADLKAMVGKWQLVKGDLGGQDVTEHLKSLDFQIFPNGKYIAKVGKEVDEGTFIVNPSKTPREMDISTGKGGPSAGKVLKAIYKLDGDDLIICYELSGGDRPTKFETKPNTMQYLSVYKRKK